MVFFLYLSMRQLEPYHMAVPPFDPSNRDVVVMHVDDSFFYDNEISVDSLDVSNVDISILLPNSFYQSF